MTPSTDRHQEYIVFTKFLRALRALAERPVTERFSDKPFADRHAMPGGRLF